MILQACLMQMYISNTHIDKRVGVANQTVADLFMTARDSSILVRYANQADLLDAFYNHRDCTYSCPFRYLYSHVYTDLDAAVHDAPLLRYWVNQKVDLVR